VKSRTKLVEFAAEILPAKAMRTRDAGSVLKAPNLPHALIRRTYSRRPASPHRHHR